MGRRLLKSLRKSQDKPLEVKIEVDDGTPVSNASALDDETVVTSIDKEVTEKVPEKPKRAPRPRQIYKPPKIWTEEFDSDESDSEAQQKGCWQFDMCSIGRGDTRDDMSYAHRSNGVRDKPKEFCGIFDCGGGVETEEEKDYKYDVDECFLPEAPTYSTIDKEPSSPDTAMTLLLLDSYEVLSEAGESDTQRDESQRGVEQTLDAFWVTAAKTKDVDSLARKGKKKRGKTILLKRWKGYKQRKGQEVQAPTPEERDGDRAFMSIESTSTTGDSTVISIKHIISDTDSHGEQSRERKDCTLNSNGEQSRERKDCTLNHDNECNANAASPGEDLPTVEDPPPVDDPPSVDSTVKETLQNEDLVKTQDLISELSRPAAYTYESLGTDGSDDDSIDDMSNDTEEKSTTSGSLLNRVFDAIEIGVNVLSFPEIQPPRKRKFGKRVRFAPDVKFNDDYDDHDYSMDYSYSDPEFDYVASFEEEMYYTTEDEEEIEDDEDFFDETPLPNATSKRISQDLHSSKSSDRGTEPPPSAVEDDDNRQEDEDDDISDEEDCSSAFVGKVSAESGFGYLHTETGEIEGSADEGAAAAKDAAKVQTDTGETEEESADEGSAAAKESSSSYETTTETETDRGASPSEPSLETLESPHLPTNVDDDNDYALLDPAYGYLDADADLEEEYYEYDTDESPSYESFEEMKASNAMTSSKPSKKSLESSHSFKDDSRQRSIEQCTKIDATTGVDNRNDIKPRKKPLKLPHPLNYSEHLVKTKKEHAEIDAMVMEADERTGAPNHVIRDEGNAHVALVERYLDIAPSSLEKQAEARGPDALTSDDDAVSINESAKEESEAPTNHDLELALETHLKTEAEDFPNDNFSENFADSRICEANDDFPDWLYSAEMQEAQVVMNSSTNTNEVAREGLQSPLINHGTRPESERVGEAESVVSGLHSQEAHVDSFTCDDSLNSKKNEAAVKRLRSSTGKRSKPEVRISDKKESLQLSLQGFARAKDTSNWANFNNAPFQDLEVAPFDEM